MAPPSPHPLETGVSGRVGKSLRLTLQGTVESDEIPRPTVDNLRRGTNENDLLMGHPDVHILAPFHRVGETGNSGEGEGKISVPRETADY